MLSFGQDDYNEISVLLNTTTFWGEQMRYLGLYLFVSAVSSFHIWW